MNKSKDIVVGLGEIGKPLQKLFSKNTLVVGYDTNEKLMNNKKFQVVEKLNTRFLHVCIPFNTNFSKSVVDLIKKFNPECVIIHSTIKPNTTKKIQ